MRSAPYTPQECDKYHDNDPDAPETSYYFPCCASVAKTTCIRCWLCSVTDGKTLIRLSC